MTEESIAPTKVGRWRKQRGEAAASDVPFITADVEQLGGHVSSLDGSEQTFPLSNAGTHDSVNAYASPIPEQQHREEAKYGEARWRRHAIEGSANNETTSKYSLGDSSADTSKPEACKSQVNITPSSVVTLRSGIQVPLLGLGTRQVKPGAECRDVVRAALRAGYNLIDTAPSYGTEEDVAIGILAAGFRRDNVFIVSKLSPVDHGDFDDVKKALMASLERLRTSYLDLYLVQSPKGGSILETWDAMLQLKAQGLVRAVGLSNFGLAHLKGLAAASMEPPEVIQIELHIGLQQRALVSYCSRVAIAVIASSPLAHGRLFGSKTALGGLAARRGRTEAEFAVRWCLQRGYIAIPKTKQPKRVEVNAPFGFSLSAIEMAEIDSLDCGFVSSAASKDADLPWDILLEDVSEVSDEDMGEGKGQKRRRRRRRKGKSKGKGGQSSVGSAKGTGGKSAGTAASRWSDMITGIR